jgi:hypothetical protein
LECTRYQISALRSEVWRIFGGIGGEEGTRKGIENGGKYEMKYIPIQQWLKINGK